MEKVFKFICSENKTSYYTRSEAIIKEHEFNILFHEIEELVNVYEYEIDDEGKDVFCVTKGGFVNGEKHIFKKLEYAIDSNDLKDYLFKYKDKYSPYYEIEEEFNKKKFLLVKGEIWEEIGNEPVYRITIHKNPKLVTVGIITNINTIDTFRADEYYELNDIINKYRELGFQILFDKKIEYDNIYFSKIISREEKFIISSKYHLEKIINDFLKCDEYKTTQISEMIFNKYFTEIWAHRNIVDTDTLRNLLREIICNCIIESIEKA